MLSILTTLLSLLKVLFVSRRLTQVSEPFPQRFPVCTWRVTPDFQVAVYSLRKSLRRNFQLPSCSRLQQWQLCQQINRTVHFKTISWFHFVFRKWFQVFFHTAALKTLIADSFQSTRVRKENDPIFGRQREESPAQGFHRDVEKDQGSAKVKVPKQSSQSGLNARGSVTQVRSHYKNKKKGSFKDTFKNHETVIHSAM